MTSDGVVPNSLVENSVGCVLLPGVVPNYRVMKTQVVVQGIGGIAHKNGLQGPTTHCLPQCVEERMIYQGFQWNGHTQFQKICDKLFLCCLVSYRIHDAGFPQAWKNLAFQLDEGESFLTKLKAL